ncbi:MAG: glutamine--fructose-6-phosphate aminotransferase [Candidatus Sericytochromatia bacterium]|nr:MAG: glutamine--fructose-6-phosphate aminotransferase [Candidatus Sericytochromatia bacterium]
MCGIVGYIGYQLAKDIILDGLKKLEYRGYDSSGISIIFEKGKLETIRKVGKLKNLENELKNLNLNGNIGIGHTRWATHGKPSEINAHPHTDESGKLVIVHNGIIENYMSLKNELKSKYEFKSDTDTEVIAHLIMDNYKGDLYQAVKLALRRIEGTYALVVMHADNTDYIIATKNSSPLIIGLGENENFVASDIPAILNHTRDIIYLDDQDIAIVYKDKIDLFNKEGNKVSKNISKISWSISAAEKGGFEHFMLKEIYEQPFSITQSLAGRVSEVEGKIYIEDLNLKIEDLNNINRIVILACGTSYYAGIVGKYYLENILKIPTDVDYSSEFRYRNPVIDNKTLVIAISQSGETADTLAAIKLANSLGAKTLGILNVIGSAISRETIGNIYIHCGPEIGVASTKAFTSTLTCLYLFALYFAQEKKMINSDYIREKISNLKHVPKLIEKIFSPNSIKNIKNISNKLANFKDCLYLGRNYNYPIALEGALKLKEISYIHAEGYPAGEMKHGPIALIDKNTPVIAICTESSTYDKVFSNIKEVKARDALTITIATEGDLNLATEVDYIINVQKLVKRFHLL